MFLLRAICDVVERILLAGVNFLIQCLNKKPSRLAFFLTRLQLLIPQIYTVTAGNQKLLFSYDNELTYMRAASFFDKEPETIEWLDSIPSGSCLWDIGANVGLYSVYAAKVRECEVVAFEPSVFNLEVLAKNTVLNGISHRITIFPIALSSESKSATFRMTNTSRGGACSTFGEGYGYDGHAFDSVFEYKTISVPGDEVISLYNGSMRPPNFIKMDVDGIEHIVIRGMKNILQTPELKGILVEINENFEEQRKNLVDALESAGFSLTDRRRTEYDFPGCYNYIWNRVQ